MDVPKAIFILGYPQKVHPKFTYYDYREAIRLGIEAMKRLRNSRQEHILMSTNLLPGETSGVDRVSLH